ncbi:Lysophospholipase [Podosphaera aphanis]|nr:Lysophospholipase [Podosphaera aphanis]
MLVCLSSFAVVLLLAIFQGAVNAAPSGVSVSTFTEKRAFPDSPSGGYAPAVVNCPEVRPQVRQADSLSPEEKSWLILRRQQTVAPMTAWLSMINIPGFDANSYMEKVSANFTALPNIGISLSGGGYRALMNGGGFLAAADSRVDDSTGPGKIGGLLQSSTYLSSLSGGGWLTGSMYVSNFSSVQTLRDGSNGSTVWKFENSILQSPKTDGFQLFDNVAHFASIFDTVKDKADAGFNTSLTDYWGRALSFQLINATAGGPAFTFSSIARQENFMDASIPFPMFVADDGEKEGVRINSENSTVYEINPFELGSWDSSTHGFAPTRYLGSNFSAGAVAEDGKCVQGFDQAGFLMGTTSSLFNQVLVFTDGNQIPGFLQSILKKISDDGNDVAQFQPNPFFKFNEATNLIAESSQLTLADGGIDGQNIALYPLVQPQRAVDVIFAVDSSADTNFNWPNGTAMVATYRRSLLDKAQNGFPFPAVPDSNSFINLGLNNRPVFFGCDPTNITGDAPLIVYIPNAPYLVQSNASTLNLSYTDTQRNSIIQNGFDVATQGNSTLDPMWPTCMGCATLSRSFVKTATPVPDACKTCFTSYCWDGTLNSTQPEEYNPTNKLQPIVTTM